MTFKMKQLIQTLLAATLYASISACGGGDSAGDILAGGNNNGGGSGGAQAPHVACQHRDPLRQPFFGDTHVHTVYSLDANTQGTIINPHESYRFAKGERIGIQPYNAAGEPLRFTQLLRPLDFTAITDHVELFGEVEICTNPDYLEYNSPECQFYRQSPENAFLFFNLVQLGFPLYSLPPEVGGLPGINEIPLVGAEGPIPRLPYCGPNGATCLEAAKTPWRDLQAAAEAAYDRTDNCSFTSFVAYEYTSAPRSVNLHRNVIFKSEVAPEQPPAYQEHPTPELLWAGLTDLCKQEDGCEYLTIPHNSNLSEGRMFEVPDQSADYATRRQYNEPLAEIYQHKGQSECLNTMGAGMQDELCGFEVVPYNNLTGDRFGGFNTGPAMEQDYLREALKDGIKREEEVGVNPFKYGLIGSSDTHLGTPGLTLEKDFPGHGGAGAAATEEAPPGLTDLIEYSPGGLAVLWAEENTRESLFDAMRRREAYATSGTRPVVRFFGGWDIPEDICEQDNFAQSGYDNGVPMGGDLPANTGAVIAPSFAVSALRDPGVAGSNAQPLQRIQIIKGWVENGEKLEAVIEVAGDPNNGASVDVNTCQTSGSGFDSLCSVWKDPDFDPGQHAFYYARVVENPTCRWATQQCIAADINCDDPESVPEEFANCCNADYPKTIQERAWTSPIWYQPEQAASEENT